MKKKSYSKWILLSLVTVVSLYCLTISSTVRADYNVHPRILLTPERITRIQTQHYSADSYEWQQLLRGASRSDMDAARAQAFVYAITGDTSYADSAIALLEEEMQDPMTVGFNSVGGKFFNMACVFDWLYNYPGFTAELKQQMIDYVNAVPMEGSGKWNWYPDTVYMNGAAKPLYGPPVWGLATYGDNPNADIYIDNGYQNRWVYIRNALGFSEINHAVNRDGDQPKGMDYGSGYYSQIMTYLDATKTATNVNFFDEAPALKEYLEWFAKSYYYTEDFIRRPEHGHNAHKEEGYHPTAIMALRTLIDNYSDTTEAKWAQWWLNNTEEAQSAANDYRYRGPEGVIFTNYDQAEQNFSSEPLAYFSEGNGSWVARSDWPAYGQEPMTYATFRAGNWTWFSQTHWDQGDFDLYSHGAPLLVDGGTYEGGGGAPTKAYHHQSIAHNTLLIKDPEQNQAWNHFDWTIAYPEWNSGGQNVPYRETLSSAILDGEEKDTSVPYSSVGYLHDQADVLRKTNNDRYTYAYADITNAYANTRWEEDYSSSRLNQVNYRPKVDNVTRQWIYLRPRTGNDQEYIVTFDRVDSTNASFQKKNLLHTIGEPILDGSIINTEVVNHIETHQANTFSMEYDGAVLHGNIVLPANAEVRKVGGYNYEYWVNGQNYFPFASNPDDFHNHLEEAGVWRMEIMPPVDQTNDLFLNVLHPDWSGTDAPTVTGISSALHEGTSFDGWVLMFSDQESVRSQASYTVEMTGEQQHLIFDMQQNFDYSIYRNNQLITSVSSGSEGIVEFVATAGGDFDVLQGDSIPDDDPPDDDPPDNTPPTGSININSGDTNTNSVNVVLDLLASDQSGVSQMQFSNDNSIWSNAENYDTTKNWVLSEGNGLKVVYVKFRDDVGNWNTTPYSDTITLDTDDDNPEDNLDNIWITGDSEKIFQDSVYQADNYFWDGDSNEATLYSAKNEVVAFQLALRNTLDIDNINVVVGDLNGTGTISADNIDLYLEHFNLVDIASNNYPGDFGFMQEWPDALLPFSDPYESNQGDLAAPFDLSANTTEIVWVDIYVPEQTQPGEYVSPISVYAGEDLVGTLTLKLNVWDFALPKENHLDHYGLITSRWGDGEDVSLRNYPSSWSTLKNYLIDGRKHRLSWDDTYWPVPTFNSSGVLTSMNWTEFDFYKGQVLNGTLFSDTPMSNNTFELVRINWPIGGSYPAGSPDIFYINEDDIGNSVYENQIRTYIEEYVSHFVDNNWNMPLFVYGSDEVGSADLHIWWAELIDQANANLIANNIIDEERVLYMRTRSATPADPDNLRLLGYVDLWMTRANGYDIDFFQDRQEAGDKVGFYHWSEPYVGHHTINTYGLSMRTKPIIAWKYNIDVLYAEWSATHWQYISQLYNGQANDYYNTRWGNGVLYYPGHRLDQVGLADIDGPVPSIRLKGLRRGMQDYEYAWLLNDSGGNPDQIINQVLDNALSDATCEDCLGDWSHSAEDWYDMKFQLGEAIVSASNGNDPPDDDPPPGGGDDDTPPGGGDDDTPPDNPPDNDLPVDDEDLDHLTGVDWETLERVSATEANIIYNYNQFVNLDDIEVSLYSNLVARQTSELSGDEKYSIAMFIHDGTQTTYRLGAGERAGVVNSYRSVFGRLPKVAADWQDVIKIANGRWPYESNTDKEAEAESTKFQRVYLRSADMENPNDNAAVTIMTYGLRPVDRNMSSERNGINIFKAIYGYDPTSAEDWDIVRAIAYSGAIR